MSGLAIAAGLFSPSSAHKQIIIVVVVIVIVIVIVVVVVKVNLKGLRRLDARNYYDSKQQSKQATGKEKKPWYEPEG